MIKIVCINKIEKDSDIDYWMDLLTIGKVYDGIINEFDWKGINYYYRVCINNNFPAFPKECFTTLEDWREQQMKSILDD
jgi:hypothetical protein